MDYRGALPVNCPANEAEKVNASRTRYRMIKVTTPTEQDFHSQRKLKPNVKFRVPECFASGISLCDHPIPENLLPADDYFLVDSTQNRNDAMDEASSRQNFVVHLSLTQRISRDHTESNQRTMETSLCVLTHWSSLPFRKYRWNVNQSTGQDST